MSRTPYCRCYPPDLEFGFNTHVRDGRQLLRKFSALPCFECAEAILDWHRLFDVPACKI